METEMKNQAITVKTVIEAPLEKVWKSWTTPEDITKWCQASDDWHAPHAENDLRAGGRFVTTMAAKDGSMSFDFGGVYTEVVHHKTIAYKIDDGRTVKISFDDQGGRTIVTETFEIENANPAEMQRAGWQAILDNFKKYTESR